MSILTSRVPESADDRNGPEGGGTWDVKLQAADVQVGRSGEEPFGARRRCERQARARGGRGRTSGGGRKKCSWAAATTDAPSPLRRTAPTTQSRDTSPALTTPRIAPHPRAGPRGGVDVPSEPPPRRHRRRLRSNQRPRFAPRGPVASQTTARSAAASPRPRSPPRAPRARAWRRQPPRARACDAPPVEAPPRAIAAPRRPRTSPPPPPRVHRQPRRESARTRTG